MIKKQNLAFGIILLTAASAVFTIFFYHYSIDIEGIVETENGESVVDTSAVNKPVVYISVVSRYPPNIIYSGYQPMLDYLTSQTPYRFELRLCDDYNQAVQLLQANEVAAAFLGSYVYIKARAEFGMIPLLKPLNSNGEPFSRSVLFTAGTKNIYRINDLKQKRIALPSRESYSYNWLVHHELKKHNIRRSDLAEIVTFPHHQSVIQNVMNGTFDAGVTREFLIKRMGEKNVRILMYSDPFPTSPVVVARDHSPEIVAAIKRVLLASGRENPDHERITRGWDNEFINGFVEAGDADYNTIRAMEIK